MGRCSRGLRIGRWYFFRQLRGCRWGLCRRTRRLAYSRLPPPPPTITQRAADITRGLKAAASFDPARAKVIAAVEASGQPRGTVACTDMPAVFSFRLLATDGAAHRGECAATTPERG